MKSLKILMTTITIIITVAIPNINYAAGIAKNNSVPMKKGQKPYIRTKEFKVNGIAAWAEAKKNGFKFYQALHKSGSKNGVDEWAGVPEDPKARRTGVGNATRRTPSHLLAGVNFILHPCHTLSGSLIKTQRRITCSSRFFLFAGAKLKKGWTIKEIKITGAYQWIRKYKNRIGNLGAVIKLNNVKSRKTSISAMLNEITLVGPINGNWKDAFDVR